MAVSAAMGRRRTTSPPNGGAHGSEETAIYGPRGPLPRATSASRGANGSSGSNGVTNGHGSSSHHHQGGFFSRQSIMILMIGVLTGYVLIPMVLVEISSDDYMTRIDFSNTRAKRVASTPSDRGNAVDSVFDKSEVARNPSLRMPSNEIQQITPIIDNRALIDGEDDMAESDDKLKLQHLMADQQVLSRHSLPTPTTPRVMRTQTLSDHMRKKILVTGGAGFVGSHLVDKLMMEGHEVVVIDNFFTGQKKNIAHWLHHPNFSLMVHDVTEPITIEVDQIYHLACPASPPHYQYNPVKTIKTSTMGTLNMLGLAKRVGARVLLSSTSEIYGDPEVTPQKESYWGNVNTIGPRACYDEGKRVAETMMYSYKTQNKVDVRVARIFNTFGPRMHPNDGRVVSNFIIQALQGKDLTIYGEGEQTRSFQYVSDLVNGLHALMNGDYDKPVNLGNPDEYSIKDFATKIKTITKSKSEIRKLAATEDDPKQRKPDITTAKMNIGWQPVVAVDSGLEKTIEYFSGVLKVEGEIIPTGPNAVKPEA